MTIDKTMPPIEDGDAAFVPENSRTFRMARLLLLLSTARSDGRRIESLDRLTYYEFFADNPWVVVDGDSNADAADRDTLRLAGFSRTQLSYASTGQRFVSRRGRIRSDFAQLVSYGLAEISSTQFKRLEAQVERWLGHSWLLLDLLDDVRGADVPALPEVDHGPPTKTRLQEED
jgi:hypothetical protein